MPPGVWREAPGNWIRLFPNNQTDFTRSLRMTPLRQRMVDDMQLRNLAVRTQKQYIAQVAAFAKYCGTSPENLDIEILGAGPEILGEGGYLSDILLLGADCQIAQLHIVDHALT